MDGGRAQNSRRLRGSSSPWGICGDVPIECQAASCIPPSRGTHAGNTKRVDKVSLPSWVASDGIGGDGTQTYYLVGTPAGQQAGGVVQ